MSTGSRLLFILFSAVSLAFAQREETQTDDVEALRQKMGKAFLPTTQSQLMAFESTIDPRNYFVGPSDVIAVNVWGAPTISYVLPVSPEGTLTIPAVGEVMVSDMTLADAKNKIIGAVRRRFPRGEVTVTLMTPRPIIVIVTGNVLYPGVYTLTASDRTQKAIEEANKPAKADLRQDFRLVMATMSTRNVVLKRKDGSLARVDIPKFLATRNDRWNPYLREGDVVIVPRKDESRNVLGIYGEVNLPGRYEYVDGDSLKDVLLLALGFTRRARADSVEFIRMDSTRSSLKSSFVKVNLILAGLVPDIALEPGDRIVVRGMPDWRNDERATIVGEVQYPGTYPMLRGSTKLSTLVQAAGGFTGREALHRAHISRRPLTMGDALIDSLLSLRGRSYFADDGFFQNEIRIRLRREIVAVDFENLFRKHDTTADVWLEPEDTVYIPSITQTVYVYGEVATPGYIGFIQDKSADYFIGKAGGYLDRAYKSGVKVIKADTKQWLDPDETRVEEGDYIWVPKEPDRGFDYYLSIIGQTASVLSVAITTILIVTQLKK